MIGLCATMMAGEIVGGLLFGSIALVADGLHMSTHAGALLLAALAYSLRAASATDSRFSFGTGKLGDLAGLHQRHRAGDDRAADRLRGGQPPVRPGADPLPRGDSHRRARPCWSTSPAPGCSAAATMATRMDMGTATATRTITTTTKRAPDRHRRKRVGCSKCSRTACHRVSGFARSRAARSAARAVSSRPSGPTAPARLSP